MVDSEGEEGLALFLSSSTYRLVATLSFWTVGGPESRSESV